MDIMTLEEALEIGRVEAADLFAEHVNPAEGKLFKLVDMDKRYVSAEGVYLFDDSGRSYMDLTAGYGSLNLGHNPKEVIEASNRVRALPAVLIAGFNPLMGALGLTLSRLLPGELSVCSYGNGGAEGVEMALKTARSSTRRRRLVSCLNGYHGLTFGALTVSKCNTYCETLGRFSECCEFVPFGDLNALEKALKGDDVAAFIVEPVQGEGGANVAPDGYLRGAKELCQRHGTLLILDEIQTGFGRTGKMFAMEHDGVIPDIVVLSKSLASGVMPISVSVTTPEIWDAAYGKDERFDLVISTFGGNPPACAAALKTIEVMLRDDIPSKADKLGEYAKKRLSELRDRHDTIKAVRGRGLLLGLELEARGLGGKLAGDNYVAMVISRLLNGHGILTAYYDLCKTVVRFEPPLVITKEQIDQAIDAIDKTLGSSTLGLAGALGKTFLKRSLTRS